MSRLIVRQRVSPQLFARAGYSVVVYDILFSEQSKIDECLKAICDQLSSMEREKMLWNQKADEVKGRIAAVHSLEEALNGAVYVQVRVFVFNSLRSMARLALCLLLGMCSRKSRPQKEDILGDRQNRE